MTVSHPPTHSVEFDLLCLAVRPKPDLGRVLQILQDGIDFTNLLDAAANHGVRPQLIRSLAELSWATVPAERRSALEFFLRRHSARMLLLSDELGRLAAAFAHDGIPFAAFKGAALATALYGDLSRREYNDIDIIVPEQRMDDAERIITSFGYRGAQGDRAFRRAFLNSQRQYAFHRVDREVVIDLHWAFSGAHLPFPLTPAEVWRDLDRVSIGDREIPTVSKENLALLLAGHGTKETWRSLSWVCDFAMLLERQPDLDWLAIHRRAKAHGCGNAVLLAGAMANELLETSLPPALRQLIDGSTHVSVLARRLSRRLREGLPESEMERNFSDFHLCDRRIDRLKGAIRLAVTPTSGDYEAMRLPPVLWPAYYVTRPFRLAAKALAALR